MISGTLHKEANRHDDDDYYCDDLEPVREGHVVYSTAPLIMTWNMGRRNELSREKIVRV
jgi:hypothetical protein